MSQSRDLRQVKRKLRSSSSSSSSSSSCALLFSLLLRSAVDAAAPPGRAPFKNEVYPQPVPGAIVPSTSGDLICAVEEYGAKGDNFTNNTLAIQEAIDACGDRAEGGTVTIGSGGTDVFLSNPIWLRSNLTLRIEEGATLQALPAGGDISSDPLAWPWVYTRREGTMKFAYSGFVNGARCTKMKSPLVGWDDCEAWGGKLHNVVLEGPGTIDGDGAKWIASDQGNLRPTLLDLLWIDGLTLRNLRLRRPAFWTTMPAFCNNVRMTGMDVVTDGANTDGVDPDSTWNMYIAENTISSGDDCVAIKAGRDWSGRMVNISTRNILIEKNDFQAGHGVSIGSETSGWIEDVVIRDSNMSGTDRAVRIKSARGRGGGARNITYENMQGEVDEAISLTLNCESSVPPTNATATPEMHDVAISQLNLTAESLYMLCEGLPESPITGVAMGDVAVGGDGSDSLECSYCSGSATGAVSPDPCFDMGTHKEP